MRNGEEATRLNRETQLAAGRLKVGVWRPAFGDLSLGLQLQTMSRAAVTNKTSRRQSPFCDECWQPSLTGQHSDVRSSLNLAAGRMACLNERCSATNNYLFGVLASSCRFLALDRPVVASLCMLGVDLAVDPADDAMTIILVFIFLNSDGMLFHCSYRIWSPSLATYAMTCEGKSACGSPTRQVQRIPDSPSSGRSPGLES